MGEATFCFFLIDLSQSFIHHIHLFRKLVLQHIKKKKKKNLSICHFRTVTVCFWLLVDGILSFSDILKVNSQKFKKKLLLKNSNICKLFCFSANKSFEDQTFEKFVKL